MFILLLALAWEQMWDRSCGRELHGNGDDGITADTAVIPR